MIEYRPCSPCRDDSVGTTVSGRQCRDDSVGTTVSGRRDLNLRPLDSQRRPTTLRPVETPNPGRSGAVQVGSAHFGRHDAYPCSILAPERRSMIMPRLPCLPYVEVVELGRGVTELRQP